MRRRQSNEPPRATAERSQSTGCGVPVGVLTSVGGQHVGGDDEVGLVEHMRGLKQRPIQLGGVQGAAHIEVVGEAEWQAELGCEAGAVVAAAQEENARGARGRGRGLELVPQPGGGARVAQQTHQINEVAREVVGTQ